MWCNSISHCSSCGFFVSINPNKVVPSDFAWLHGQCAWTCAYCKAFPPMYLLEEHDGREPPQLPRASPATRWKTTIDYTHHKGCEVGEIPKKILKWNFRIGENWKWLKTQKWRQQKRAGRREMKTEEKWQKRSKDRGKVKTAENWRQKSEDTKQLKKPNTKDGRKLTEDNCSLKRSDKTQVKEQTTKGSERAGNARRKSFGRTKNKKQNTTEKAKKLKIGGKWRKKRNEAHEQWNSAEMHTAEKWRNTERQTADCCRVVGAARAFPLRFARQWFFNAVELFRQRNRAIFVSHAMHLGHGLGNLIWATGTACNRLRWSAHGRVFLTLNLNSKWVNEMRDCDVQLCLAILGCKMQWLLPWWLPQFHCGLPVFAQCKRFLVKVTFAQKSPFF